MDCQGHWIAQRRCRQSVSENFGEVDVHIDVLVAEWKNEVERCRDSRRKLEYRVPTETPGVIVCSTATMTGFVVYGRGHCNRYGMSKTVHRKA